MGNNTLDLYYIRVFDMAEQTDLGYELYNKEEEFKYLQRPESDLLTKLFRSRVPIDDPLHTGYSYIFMTCPRMALLPENYNSIKLGKDIDPVERFYNNTARHLGLPLSNSTKKQFSMYDPRVVKMLAGNSGISRFMLPLTNLCVKYTAVDTKLDTMDYAETWNKNKIVLGTTDKDSKLAGTIQLEYMENNNLLIMKTHNLWKNYIDKSFLGDIITPQALAGISVNKSVSVGSAYIDYATSLYHFVTLPDSETLIYWAKFTGVFPVNIPWSIFTSDDGNINIPESVPIEYQYSYKEEMSMNIIRDFNMVSYGAPTSFNPAVLDYYEGSSVDINVPGNTGTFPRVIANPNTSDDLRINSYSLLLPTSYD